MTDEVGGTPAHDAADNGELECLKFLVDRGADIFAEDLNKATPYLLGLESGNDAVKSYLRKLALTLGSYSILYYYTTVDICYKNISSTPDVVLITSFLFLYAFGMSHVP